MSRWISLWEGQQFDELKALSWPNITNFGSAWWKSSIFEVAESEGVAVRGHPLSRWARPMRCWPGPRRPRPIALRALMRAVCRSVPGRPPGRRGRPMSLAPEQALIRVRGQLRAGRPCGSGRTVIKRRVMPLAGRLAPRVRNKVVINASQSAPSISHRPVRPPRRIGRYPPALDRCLRGSPGSARGNGCRHPTRRG